MPAAGQKARIQVRYFAARLVQFRKRLGLTAGSRHSQQWAVGHREDDGVVRAPRALTMRSGYIANNLRRPSAGIDLLQLVLSKEPNETSVRRPERLFPIFGAIQQL